MEKATSSKQCGYFTLFITGKYDRDYWLIIECKEKNIIAGVQFTPLWGMRL